MKNRAIIFFIFSLSCFFTGYAQSLRDIKKMMVEAREPGSLPCMVIGTGYDTTWGNDLEWKWNNKSNEGEYHVGGKVFREDSILFYQDKKGFHSIVRYESEKGKIAENCARIIKGNIDVFVSNWDFISTHSTFNPGIIPGTNNIDLSKAGNEPGTGRYSPSLYFIRKKAGTPFLVTYRSLKEYISDNIAALAQLNSEFNSGDDPNKAIIYWGKLKSVFDFYNQ